MKALAFAIVLLLPAPAAFAQAFDWQQAQVGNGSVLFAAASAKSARVSVVYLAEKTGSRAPSLMSFAFASAPRGDYMLFAADAESLRSSGYRASSRFAPRGLLVVNGRLISQPEEFAKGGAQGAGECASAIRESQGAVCVSHNGSLRAIKLTDDEAPWQSCKDAIQGRYLVIQGKQQRCLAEGDAVRNSRTSVCFRSSGEFVFLYSGRVNVSDLVQWMVRPVKAKGLGCDDALELSQDPAAAALIYTGADGLRTMGPASGPAAAAIFMQPR